MEQPFYIGQKVVAIKNCNNKHGEIKQGQIFTVLGMVQCLCGNWRVDVGLREKYEDQQQCGKCFKKMSEVSNKIYVRSDALAPIQEGFEAITFERVMEEEKVSVN